MHIQSETILFYLFGFQLLQQNLARNLLKLAECFVMQRYFHQMGWKANWFSISLKRNIFTAFYELLQHYFEIGFLFLSLTYEVTCQLNLVKWINFRNSINSIFQNCENKNMFFLTFCKLQHQWDFYIIYTIIY